MWPCIKWGLWTRTLTAPPTWGIFCPKKILWKCIDVSDTPIKCLSHYLIPFSTINVVQFEDQNKAVHTIIRLSKPLFLHPSLPMQNIYWPVPQFGPCQIVICASHEAVQATSSAFSCLVSCLSVDSDKISFYIYLLGLWVVFWVLTCIQIGPLIHTHSSTTTTHPQYL